MTIVIDASAMAELLNPRSPVLLPVADALAEDPEWVVPGHFAVEVANALRGLLLGKIIDEKEFSVAIDSLAHTHLEEFSISPLLGRIVQLLANATPYDAAYVALAEHLEAEIVTTDAKLAKVPGIDCAVRVIR